MSSNKRSGPFPDLLLYLLVLLFFALASSTLRAQPVPIVEYKFNESNSAPNNILVNTGSDSTEAEMLKNEEGAVTLTPWDLHSADGGGLTGLAGDRSFNNADNPTMGFSSWRGDVVRGVSAVDLPAVDNLQSLTMQGWFRTDSITALSGWATLHFNQDSYYLRAAGDTVTGALEFGIGLGGTLVGTTGIPAADTKLTRSETAYDATEEWVFFACTYDGTNTDSNSQNVRFYIGSLSDSVVEVPIYTDPNTLVQDPIHPADGPTPASAKTLILGNYNSLKTPFDGFLDNMRIFGSAADATGVLSVADLEAIRVADGGETANTTSGDFNHNGTIDAADYVVWRKNLGATGGTPYEQGDGDGDGAVTQTDYNIWVSQFGQTIPIGSASMTGAVPEPSAFVVLLIGVGWLLMMVRTPMLRIRA